MTLNKEKRINIDIISCQSCGKLEVALGNKDGSMRLGPHKCAGAWTTIHSFSVRSEQLLDDVKQCIKIYSWDPNSQKAKK